MRRPRRVGRSPAFELEEGERDRGEDGVMHPAPIAAALEMIDAQFILELPILLLDGPAAARHGHQVVERRGGVEIQQVVLPGVVGQRALAQQPAVAATRRARPTIVSVMSMPIARPFGPTA